MSEDDADLPDDFGTLPISDEEIMAMEPFFPPDWTPDNPKYWLPDDLTEVEDE